jgi:hypothetical protein
VAKPKDTDKGKAKKKKQQDAASVPATPVITAEPVDVPVDVAPVAESLTPRGFINRLSGARLCYGKPVTGADLTIVPVARVRVAGGFGTGDDGEGGGGAVQAAPIGYIEVGPDGARFRPIDDPDRTLSIVRSLAVTAAAVLGAAVALRSLTR